MKVDDHISKFAFLKRAMRIGVKGKNHILPEKTKELIDKSNYNDGHG